MTGRKMDPEELNAIKDSLIEKRQSLWGKILADLEHDATGEHRELIDTIKENGDMGLEELRQSNAFTLIELKYNELLNIERALDHMEDGEYGRCLDCEGWIGPERLKVVPYAIRCRDCQARYEKRERQAAAV